MGWYEEKLNAMSACKDMDDVFHLLQKEASNLGMKHFSWGIRMPFPLPDGRFVAISDYPQEWWTTYSERGYFAIDPTLLKGMTYGLPMWWDDPSLQTSTEFWEEARGHGLREGVAQSVWGANSCGSMLSFSRDADHVTPAERAEIVSKIIFQAQLTHARMTEIILPTALPETTVVLSRREDEVLKLAASGMTSQKIADRLRLSKVTADFHLVSVINKLGVANRTEAAVKAVVLGLV